MSPSWNQTPADRWADPTLLDHLRTVREPWNRLTARIVQAVIAKTLCETAGPLVEIGAGDGQLRDWLAAELLPRLIHTEPSEAFRTRLSNRFPDARVIDANATALPFESGTVDAIIGLCVLDSLGDLISARDEFRRVLKPGGAVIHFLDLATNPDCLFPEMIALGAIPLTNFARDPGLLAVLSDAQKAILPQTGEFDEVLAVDQGAFTKLTSMLASAGHPLAKELGVFRDLDPHRLAQAYMQVTADPSRLSGLNRALLSLTLTARNMNRDWHLRSISTRDHLRTKLADKFSPAHGFEIIHAGPITAWEADVTIPETASMILRHAGQTRSRKELVTLPGMAVEEWEAKPANPSMIGPVRACTVEVFVARHSD